MDLGIHKKESTILRNIINDSVPLFYMLSFIDPITISILTLQIPLISVTV